MRIKLGDTTYDVDFEVEERGSPATYSDPGDPTVLCIIAVYLDDKDVTDEVWDSLWQELEDKLHEEYVDDDDYYVEADFR